MWLLFVIFDAGNLVALCYGCFIALVCDVRII
jgi:hypothetical protein